MRYKTAIDLMILDSIQDAYIAKRYKLLQQGNLLKFADTDRKLSRIWFSNEQYDFISQQMEDYILRGGVYGNNENCITARQKKVDVLNMLYRRYLFRMMSLSSIILFCRSIDG